MRCALVVCSIFFLLACNEEHPDNKPGAENNPHPDVSISSSASIEAPAQGQTRTYQFALHFNRPAPESGSVRVETVNGSATSGEHFESLQETLSFSEGDNGLTGQVTILHAANQTAERDFDIVLRNASNASLTDDTRQQVTITPPEAGGELPSLNLPEQLNFEHPASGSETHPVLMILSDSVPAEARVQVRTVPGSARPAEHYEAIDDEWFTIAEGRSELDLPLTLLHDSQATGDLNFRLQFVSAEGVQLPDEREVDVTIEVDQQAEVQPEVELPAELVLRAPNIDRGEISYPVVIPLAEPMPVDGEVDIEHVPGTALPQENYEPVDSPIEVPAGAQEIRFNVNLLHDDSQSENLDFQLLFASASNLSLPSDRQVPVTVVYTGDDLSPPTLRMTSFTEFHEPASGERDFQLIFPFSGPAPAAGSVRVQSQDGSARAGTNFTEIDEEITFAAGDTEISQTLTVQNDGEVTDELEFQLAFSGAENLLLPEERYLSLTIVDSDAAMPVPQLQLPGLLELPEPTGGTETFSLWFQLSEALPEAASFELESRAGTARSGVDFTAVNETIHVPAGETDVRVEVELRHTGDSDSQREFELLLGGAAGLRLPESPSVTIVIQPVADQLPELQVPGTMAFHAPASGSIEVPLLLLTDEEVPEAAQVAVRTIPGTAAAGTHYEPVDDTFTIAEGQRELDIPLELLHDPGQTEPVTFQVQLVSASGVNLPTERVIEITLEPANTNLPELDLPGSVTLPEPVSGSALYPLLLTLSERLPADGSVTVRTVPGSAQPGTDYTAIDTASYTIQAGQQELDLPLELIHNPGATGDQSFNLQFVAGDGVVLPAERMVPVTISVDRASTPEPLLNLPSSLNWRAPLASRGTISYPVVIPLAEPLAEDGQVYVETVPGAAQPGSHYEPLAETLNLSAGARELRFTVTLIHDPMQNDDLDFELLFSGAESLTLPDERSVSVTSINTNTPPLASPTLQPTSLTTFQEPESGTRDYLLVFPLSEPAPVDGHVNMRTEDGTARGGVNFEPFSGAVPFSAGDTEVTRMLTVRHDGEVTDALEFQLNITGGDGVELPAERQQTLTIVDSDEATPLPQMQVPERVTLPEPESGDVYHNVWFRFSEPLPEAASFRVESRPGNAREGTDYAPVNRVVTVAEGDTEALLPVRLFHTGDSDEVREFELLLGQASNLQLPDSPVTTVAIEPFAENLATVQVPNSMSYRAPGSDPETVPLLLLTDTPVASDAQVRVRSIADSARPGTHFTGFDEVLTIREDTQELDIPLELLHDPGQTEPVTFQVQLVSASGVNLPMERVIEITLEPANTNLPELDLPGSVTLPEPLSGTELYPVLLTFSERLPTDGAVTVRTVSGSAQPGVDYLAIDSETFTIQAGQQELDLPLQLIHNPDANDDRTFELQFVSADGVLLPGERSVEVTIDVDRVTANEPDMNAPAELVLRAPVEGRTEQVYPVVISLTERMAVPGEVSIETVPGTALPGENYVQPTSPVQVDEGAKEVRFDLTLLRDPDQTENLEFNLLLTGADNLTLPAEREIPVTVVNVNDELAAPTLQPTSFTTLQEPVSGSRQYELLFPLSAPAPQPGTVRIFSQEGTARSDVNFAAFDRLVDVETGDAEVRQIITLYHDDTVTDDLEFQIGMADGNNIELPGERYQTLTIVDSDEAVPTPQMQLPSVIDLPEPPSGSVDYSVWFRFSEPLPEDGSFRLQTRSGSATEGTHFAGINRQVTVAEGEQDVRIPLRLFNVGDVGVNREFELLLARASNIELPNTPSTTVNITASRGELPLLQVPEDPQFFTSPSPGETKMVTVPVPFDEAALLDGNVSIAVNEQGAEQGNDFELPTDQLSFQAQNNEVLLNIELRGIGAQSNRRFDVVFRRGNNLELPSDTEDRTLQVIIRPN